MKRNKFSLAVLAAVFGIMPLVVIAQNTANVTINPSIPYVSNASNIGSLVNGFYLFALAIAGILAFGAIVYGGIRYAAGRGNPSSESEGKSWITNALLGLLLLVGAYIILQTVNPGLTTLQIPGLPQLNPTTLTGFNAPSSTPWIYGCVAPNGVVACVSSTVAMTDFTCSTAVGCGNGASCIQVPISACGTTNVSPSPQCADGGCISLIPAGVSCKPASQQPSGQLSCSAAYPMLQTLQCITSQPGAPPIEVTEAMPPTVPHLSSCHNDGCCADVVVSNFTSCSQVTALMNAVSACGATAANEYVAAGCPGATSYETTQGNNVHINAANCP